MLLRLQKCDLEVIITQGKDFLNAGALLRTALSIPARPESSLLHGLSSHVDICTFKLHMEQDYKPCVNAINQERFFD